MKVIKIIQKVLLAIITMKGLFIIKEGNKVILDDYIMSKDQFISTIKKL